MFSIRHPLAPRRVGLLACLLLLLPLVALAQSSTADAGIPDGGIRIPLPDASIGEGGADRDNPEGEDGTGRVNSVCRSTRDCSPRFTCQDGTCRYTGVREAERVGCLLGPEAALVLVGLSAAAPRRKKR
jgi:hypothetical protein